MTYSVVFLYQSHAPVITGERFHPFCSEIYNLQCLLHVFLGYNIFHFLPWKRGKIWGVMSGVQFPIGFGFRAVGYPPKHDIPFQQHPPPLPPPPPPPSWNKLQGTIKGEPDVILELERLFHQHSVWSNSVRLAACLVILLWRSCTQHIFILQKKGHDLSMSN